MIVSERGNLTGGIFLSPARMSTVKIRSRSLFHTPGSRIGAAGAGSGVNSGGFSALLHSSVRRFTACTQAFRVSRLRWRAARRKVR
jgi:hypothetical protein